MRITHDYIDFLQMNCKNKIRNLNTQIEYAKVKIVELEQGIKEIQTQIAEQEEQLEFYSQQDLELTRYEARPIEEQTLYAYIHNDTGTVDLFDRFESEGENQFPQFIRRRKSVSTVQALNTPELA